MLYSVVIYYFVGEDMKVVASVDNISSLEHARDLEDMYTGTYINAYVDGYVSGVLVKDGSLDNICVNCSFDYRHSLCPTLEGLEA